MWKEAEMLLNTASAVLPAAGMPDTGQQVLNTTGANPFTVTKKHQTKLPGICLECQRSLYRSTPNVCPHCLAATEDLSVLGAYLDWAKNKAGKSAT